MTYQLPSGILSFCHGFWNEQTKQFDTGTPEQIVKCCLDSCLNHVNYCFKVCSDSSSCSKCYELKQACENGCLEYDTKQNIPVYTQVEGKTKAKTKNITYIIILVCLLVFFIIKLKFY